MEQAPPTQSPALPPNPAVSPPTAAFKLPSPPNLAKPATSLLPPNATSQLITDVKQTTWQYIRGNSLPTLVALIASGIIWEVFAFWLFVSVLTQVQTNAPSSNNHSNGSAYILAVPFIVIGSWYARIKKKIEDAFIAQFAAANNFNYQKNLPASPDNFSSQFQLGHSHKFSDLVKGTFENLPFYLFLYEFTVGSGKNQQTYDRTIIEIQLQGYVPNIFAQAVKSSGDWLSKLEPTAIPLGNQIKLEGDFDDFYHVFAKPGEEVNALEIFAPDLMQQLILEPSHFDIELVQNVFYIYANRYIDTAAELQSMYNFARAIAARIEPVAGRMRLSGQEATLSQFARINLLN